MAADCNACHAHLPELMTGVKMVVDLGKLINCVKVRGPCCHTYTHNKHNVNASFLSLGNAFGTSDHTQKKLPHRQGDEGEGGGSKKQKVCSANPKEGGDHDHHHQCRCGF